MDLLPCDVDLDIFSLSSMNCMNYEEHVFICDLMISTIYAFFVVFSSPESSILKQRHENNNKL